MIRLRPSGADEVLIKRVRDWYEPGPGVFIAPQALFNPALLFTTGVNGTWYDPSDITRYMSSLGPELVTNGGFDTDTGWTKGSGWSISGGVASATGTLNNININQPLVLTQGKTYQISVTCINYSSGSFFLLLPDGSTPLGLNVTGVGKKSAIFTASANSSGLLYLSTGLTLTATFDNISVRELTAIDTATLFQDAAGTTPVTAVEQPVGLMLDKSKGLVLGQDIKPTSGSWVPEGSTVATSNSPTSVTFNASPAGDAYASATPVAVNSNVEISYTVSGYSSGGVSIQYGYGATKTYVAANGTYTKRVSALGDGALYVFCSAGTTATVTINSAKIVSGNHAFNSSGNSANFPVLSARYNLLTKTEQFDDAVWTKTRCSINANAITAPDGTLTADKLIEDSSASTTHAIQSSAQTLPLGNYTGVFYGKAAERTWAVLGIGASTTGIAYFDLLNGLVGTVTGGYTASIQSVGNGWFKCTLTGQAAATLTNPYAIYTATGNNGGSYTGDGTSGIYIWGADLRVANDALNQPAYQRVNTATDYDTVGFKPYLKFNGTNQWLQTNSIDFSYGDKMFVAAGVRKLSDAVATTLLELSVTSDSNTGSFYLRAPDAGYPYGFKSRGTANAWAQTSSTYSAPITNVISGIGDISGDQAILRVNGTQAASSTADQGTGNYGNYPLYIGARAGTSLWFNGRLHQLIVAGKQASASEIGQTEAFTNQKTGAY